ncbi:hypothetical protein H0H93_005419 [Arthromyces matolae]|nr:hypothetical protein H0H93_005419 [Arthromyces matolae]
MQSHTIVLFLAGLVFLFGPLVSDASPIPPDPSLCVDHTGGKTAKGVDTSDECLKKRSNHDVEGSVDRHAIVEAEWSSWHSWTELHLSKDGVIEAIKHLKSTDVHDVSGKLESIRAHYLSQYVGWLYRALIIDNVLKDLNKYAGGRFSSITIISNAFHGTSIEHMEKSTESFDSTWLTEFIKTKNIDRTLATTSWQKSTDEQLTESATLAGKLAEEGQSVVYMTECLLLRAQLLFSRNVMDEEIRRIKRLDSDPYLLILWPALKNLQTEYLRAYAIWIDRLVAFNKIVTELDKSPNNVFPSNTIISTAFSRRGIEENIEDLSPFYDSWTHVFVASNNIEHTLGQYYRALDDGHSKVLLRYFVVQNDERSLEEIFAEAETAEAAAVRGKSEMKMAESLLFRFIHARKQSNHELLQIDKNRLNTLLSSQEWDKLKALLHWLLQEYVDLGHGGREDTRHTS